MDLPMVRYKVGLPEALCTPGLRDGFLVRSPGLRGGLLVYLPDLQGGLLVYSSDRRSGHIPVP